MCGSHLTILMLKKVTRGHRHPIAHSYETHVHFYADDQTVYVTPILAVLFTSDQTDPSLLVTHDWSDKPEMFFIGSARHRHKTRPWTWIVATFLFFGVWRSQMGPNAAARVGSRTRRFDQGRTNPLLASLASYSRQIRALRCCWCKTENRFAWLHTRLTSLNVLLLHRALRSQDSFLLTVRWLQGRFLPSADIRLDRGL